MTVDSSTDRGECLDRIYGELCEWLYDGGDPDTGVSGAWVCQVCGEINVNREPPSDFD